MFPIAYDSKWKFMKASQQIKSNKNPSKLALSMIAPPPTNNKSKKKTEKKASKEDFQVKLSELRKFRLSHFFYWVFIYLLINKYTKYK